MNDSENTILNNLLFTDKYKPKKYSDLLTEERTNREILTWMMSWNPIVFNKKFTIPKIPIIQTSNFPSSSTDNNTNNHNKKFLGRGVGLSSDPINIEEQQFQEVDYVQSKHKILLISGPPGIGKTTLAKIIAMHCGYDPIIVNASDERTASKLITRIYDTTLIKNVNFNKTKKPSCLILDEIDGICDDNGNSIKCIIDFLKSGKLNKTIIDNNKKDILGDVNILMNNNNSLKNNFQKNKKSNKSQFQDNNSSDSDDEYDDNNKQNDNISNDSQSENNNNITKPKKIKKKDTSSAIKRPVICICNDLYIKSLILLRKEALVYNIKKIDEDKMVKRLCEITKSEDLPIYDKSVIRNICRQTKYDIRASLNCLQFISYNKLNTDLINSLSREKLTYIGNKDINENLFNIWNKIFYPPNVLENNSNVLFNNNNRFYSTYKNVISLYNSSGEYSKIIEGLFTNYLKVISNNSLDNCQKRAELLDLFSFEDVISTKGFKTMSYDVHNYQGMSGYYISKYYQSKKYDIGLIEYPNLFFETKKEIKISNNIIDSINQNLIEKTHYNNISKKVIVTQLVPFIFKIIQPNFTGMNYELIDKKDQKKIQAAVNVMNLFGVKFKETKENNDNDVDNEIDSQHYEPNIEKLINFSWNKNNNKFKLTENQVVILKSEFNKLQSMDNLNKIDDINLKKNNIDDEKNKVQENVKNIMNAIGFGQKRKNRGNNNLKDKFVYKFHEGVTNCVRRSLNINYFFENENS